MEILWIFTKEFKEEKKISFSSYKICILVKQEQYYTVLDTANLIPTNPHKILIPLQFDFLFFI